MVMVYIIIIIGIFFVIDLLWDILQVLKDVRKEVNILNEKLGLT